MIINYWSYIKNFAPYIITALLSIIVFHTCTDAGEPVVAKEKITVDTVFIFKTDTIIRYEPKYITQTIVRHDTLFLVKDSIVYLPITQKRYSEPNLYDVWVSGYKPQLDSIKTYNRTEYVNVEKVVEREVIKNKYELYVFGSLNAISNSFVPQVGVSLITPKRTLYKANLGLYNGQVTYGIGIGYNLF